MKALTFSELLEYIEVPKTILKEGDLLLGIKAVGLNFADIYRRKGDYHLTEESPYIAGYELHECQ